MLKFVLLGLEDGYIRRMSMESDSSGARPGDYVRKDSVESRPAQDMEF